MMLFFKRVGLNREHMAMSVGDLARIGKKNVFTYHLPLFTHLSGRSAVVSIMIRNEDTITGAYVVFLLSINPCKIVGAYCV